MDKTSEAKEWLRRAKANLKLGNENSYVDLEDVAIEDLCFNLQQCAEKALKALLVYHKVDFPKTHDIADLIKLLKKNALINIPESIKRAAELTTFAVITRYPHWTVVVQEDYDAAFDIAEEVFNWATTQIK
jgi:HEPN domain-containing protein